MDHQKKLLELCGITTLKKYTEPVTIGEMMQSGQDYLEVYDKITAQGELQLERVRNELSRLLAETLQPPAREKYGVAGSAAIKELLTEAWIASGKDGWEQQKRLFQTAAVQMGLIPDQEKAFLALMDIFPDLLTDILATEAGRLKLIPLENLNEITRVLAEMFKEERYADPSRNN